MSMIDRRVARGLGNESRSTQDSCPRSVAHGQEIILSDGSRDHKIRAFL